MSCARCKSPRVMHVGAKVSDRFWASTETEDDRQGEHEGYVPHDLGLGRGGDYFDLSYCMVCGQIQDMPEFDVVFPLPLSALELGAKKQ